MTLNKLREFLFPEYDKCIICSCELNENKRYSICDDCLEKLPFIENHCCLVCGCPLPNPVTVCIKCKEDRKAFEYNRSVFAYDSPLPILIQGLKYNGKKYLAKPLSKLMLDKFMEIEDKIDYIIPIPLNPKRLKERGYNQAELLCESFEEIGLPVLKDNLIRIKNNPQQATLSKEERKKNLENCFDCLDKKKIKNKNILLVDDIYTTGSTLNEATLTLIKAGANKVYCLTLCNASMNKI